MATVNTMWGLNEPDAADPGDPGMAGRAMEFLRYLRGDGPGVRDRLLAAAREGRDLDIGLELVGALAGPIKSARGMGLGGGLPRNVAFSTHEQVPYVGGGHLAELASASPEMRQAFSADPRSRWRGRGKGDVLLDTLGVTTRQMNTGSGLYTPPNRSELEVNPLEIGRPVVRTSPGPAAEAVSEKTIGDLNAASAARAYLDVQGASPWHMPLFNRKPEEMNSLFIPMPRGMEPDEARRLAATLKERFGLGDIADTGQGITVFGFDAPRSVMDQARAQGLDKVVAEILPKAGTPRPAYVENRYPGFEQAWEQGTGSRAATSELRRHLTAEQVAKLDASPEIARRARERLLRDEEWSKAQGWETRKDIRLAREIIEKEGFAGLFRALERGVALPAAAGLLAPILSALPPGKEDRAGR